MKSLYERVNTGSTVSKYKHLAVLFSLRGYDNL